MRKSTLVLLMALAACGDPAEDAAILLHDFSARSEVLRCDPVTLPLSVAATEIRHATDSTWTLLDDPQRRVLVFDDRLRLRWQVEIPPAGPGAAPNAVSAVALGDTAVAVVARGGLRLVILSRNGKELDSSPLEFIPLSVAAARDGGVLVTPMPYGNRPPTLLMRYDRSGWTPLPVPRRSYADMTVNALGNSALVEQLPDGAAVLFHKFMRPRAFRVETDGTVASLAPPIPDDARDQIEFLPRSPITDDQIPQIALPAMAVSPHDARSELYVMMRSGRELDGRPERAILRLDDRAGFLEGYRLPVAAVGMVYLAGPHSVLVVDDSDVFHACSLPDTRAAL